MKLGIGLNLSEQHIESLHKLKYFFSFAFCVDQSLKSPMC